MTDQEHALLYEAICHARSCGRAYAKGDNESGRYYLEQVNHSLRHAGLPSFGELADTYHKLHHMV